MEFRDVVLGRRSVRTFKNEKIPKELLGEILMLGCWAPSALNSQPWRFIVADDAEVKKRVRTAYDAARERVNLYAQDSSFLECGTLVLALCNKKSPKSELSTALACENMMLAATDAGLGSVIMTCLLDDVGVSELLRIFSVPNGFTPLALMAFGYPAESPTPKQRKPEAETVSYNRF